MKLNQENYETYLLLYIDNELTASERAAVEAFLEANPQYANEFKALQDAILAPEAITFPDKSMLYRFEEMNATLDPSFKKSLYKQTNSTGKLIEFKKRYIAYASIAAITLWMLIGTRQVFNTTTPISTTIEEQSLASTEKTVSEKDELKQAPNLLVTSSTRSKASIVNKTMDSPKGTVENQTNSTSNIVIYESDAIASNQQTSTKEAAQTINETQLNNNNLVTEAKVEKESFEEINTEDNDRVLYISNIELDGDKFRGITRKLGAIFKRNKTEKNK
jgi:hypothetical protein